MTFVIPHLLSSSTFPLSKIHTKSPDCPLRTTPLRIVNTTDSLSPFPSPSCYSTLKPRSTTMQRARLCTLEMGTVVVACAPPTKQNKSDTETKPATALLRFRCVAKVPVYGGSRRSLQKLCAREKGRDALTSAPVSRLPSTYLTTFARLSSDQNDDQTEENYDEKCIGTIDENGFLQIDNMPAFNV